MVFRSERVFSLLGAQAIFPLEIFDAPEATLKLGVRLKSDHLDMEFIEGLRLEGHLEMISRARKSLKNTYLDFEHISARTEKLLRNYLQALSLDPIQIDFKSLREETRELQDDHLFLAWVSLEPKNAIFKKLLDLSRFKKAFLSKEGQEQVADELSFALNQIESVRERFLKRVESLDKNLVFLKDLLFLVQEERLRLEKAAEEVSSA